MVLSELQYDYQKQNKARKKQDIKSRHSIMTYYDNLYTALFTMNEYPTIPKAKNGMSSSRTVQEMLIQKGFVKEVTDKKLLNNWKYNDEVSYYLTTTKGHEYLKRFEHLRELFE